MFQNEAMDLDYHHIVEAESYTTEYTVLEESFYFFHRKQNVLKMKEEVDAFGESWALAIGELLPGQVSVKVGDHWIEVVGFCLIWIPPHSTLHWRLGEGPLEWFSYIGTGPLPLGLPTETCLFKVSDFHWPKNPEDIAMLFSRAQTIQRLTPAIRNPWALKLKRALDFEYTLNRHIEDYANEFGISHESLTRAFQEEFGLAPVQYRNKMRLLQASFEILMKGRPISEVSLAVGFRDQSHFHHLFKREIRTSPRKFKI